VSVPGVRRTGTGGRGVAAGKRIACWKIHSGNTLIKKKIKFSSYIRKFRVEQLQSHIRGRKGLVIYEEKRKYFPIYEEADSYI
jgi:hypothetical protein